MCVCVCVHLCVCVSALQEDLVVESFPLGVVGQRHSELPHTGDQVPGHPLLVHLLPPHSVLQLLTQEPDESALL